jgi:hypothetical protein
VLLVMVAAMAQRSPRRLTQRSDGGDCVPTAISKEPYRKAADLINPGAARADSALKGLARLLARSAVEKTYARK